MSRDVKQLSVDRTDSPPQIVLTLDKLGSADPDTGMVVLDEGAPVRRSVVIDKVCIDAGHGGRDHGKEKRGCQREGHYTRHRPRGRGPHPRRARRRGGHDARGRSAGGAQGAHRDCQSRRRGRVHLSIHCNSWFNDQTSGFESYFLSPARSESERALARFENQAGADHGDAPGGDIEFILWDLVQNAYISESSSLAETVQRELTSRLQIKSRGVKQANFVVLQGAKMPAVLIETAFLSNPGEAEKLVDPDFHRRVAEGLVASIRRMQGAIPVMDEYERHGFDDDAASGGGLSGRQIATVGIVALVLLALGLWIVMRPSKKTEPVPEPKRVESVPRRDAQRDLVFRGRE